MEHHEKEWAMQAGFDPWDEWEKSGTKVAELKKLIREAVRELAQIPAPAPREVLAVGKLLRKGLEKE